MSTVTPPIIFELLQKLETTKLDFSTLTYDDNLFKLGLDSLDMMSLFFHIEEYYGVKIEMDEGSYREEDWNTINTIVKTVNALLS